MGLHRTIKIVAGPFTVNDVQDGREAYPKCAFINSENNFYDLHYGKSCIIIGQRPITEFDGLILTPGILILAA